MRAEREQEESISSLCPRIVSQESVSRVCYILIHTSSQHQRSSRSSFETINHLKLERARRRAQLLDAITPHSHTQSSSIRYRPTHCDDNE